MINRNCALSIRLLNSLLYRKQEINTLKFTSCPVIFLFSGKRGLGPSG